MALTIPPANWQQCRELLRSEELEIALQVRLVQLSFDPQGSTAIKAIELLRSMPRATVADGLEHVPTDILLAQMARVDSWIGQLK